MSSVFGLWNKLGLQLKLQILIQGFLLVLLIPTQLWITGNSERLVLGGAEQKAKTVAEDAISGLNTLMVAKGAGGDEVISDEKSRALFIEEMGASEKIKEVRVVRGKGVDDEFGEGMKQERPTDDLDKNVLATGRTAFEVQKGANGDVSLRAVVPYIAKKSNRASNCLKCHGVEDGAVIGAASVVIDVREEFTRLQRIEMWMWVGQIGLQIILFIITRVIIRRLLSQLGGEPAYVIDIVQRIAAGNLSNEVAMRKGDNSSLLAAMGHMQGELRSMIRAGFSTAVKMQESASQLAVSARQVLAGAERGAEASGAVAAAVEELTVSIGQVSDGATKAQSHVMETGSLAQEGSTAMERVITGMERISATVSASSEVIVSLGEQSHKISGIVQVIKEIAEQTNMLALNAAIEAARAGEHGRGFAVVADEVRKLAERTALSTQEIAAMVQAIQQGATGAVDGMAEGNARVGEGVELVEGAGRSMERIQTGVETVLAVVDEISSSLKEQYATSNQIASSVETFARVADETSSATNVVVQAVTELEQLSAELKRQVGQFQL